ncbi:tetratricopeptide repeat protein [Rubrolithibacter danxiaensis]|uniref:tetratricopeptide repeat protein n=1 Tax=Rubrolithibacter danxiaensis TaxID=3390805 RepID=UPI003BF914D9
MKSFFVVAFLLLSVSGAADAQSKKEENPYVRLGQKALIDGNFKMAITHLEKALPSENNNANVQYMLGYSYYHSGDFQKAISSFGQVISLRPGEVSAYYYRGKARNQLAVQMNSSLSPAEREKLLQASIRDFSKAIELNPEDVKLYQNRAIAYRDYGILKGQKIPKFYDKSLAANSFKSSISDLQHVLDSNPGRQDIADEMKKVKVYITSLNNK